MMILYTKAVTLTIILEDDFDVSTKDAGKVNGHLNSISAIFTMAASFFIGACMDLFGRRLPITIGLVLGGLGMIGMIFTGQIYPGIVIIITIMSVSCTPAENAPLQNDYIKP